MESDDDIINRVPIIFYGEEDSPDDEFNATIRGIKQNNPRVTEFVENGGFIYVQNITNGGWEELGRDIANNTHLTKVNLYDALNDNKMTCFFRGLTRSSSINYMILRNNQLSIAGLRSMAPFLQNANNLTRLNLQANNLKSEGFNMIWSALRDSPIERLFCGTCGIESIEIDGQHTPKHLSMLYLEGNNINADGCRELATLLRGRDATLECLSLSNNNIDDEGVSILVSALQSNTILTTLELKENDGISNHGQAMLLKLVNDVSSIKATLQSNHTLEHLPVNVMNDPNEQIQLHINAATRINAQIGNSEKAGEEKVIQTQLHSRIRAELADLQGVTRSVYSEIDPLHLPELLQLVGHRHGQGELYVALKSSIAGVISTVNRKQCLKQQKAHHEAVIAERKANLEAFVAEHNAIIAQHRTKVETIDAEIAAIEEADGIDTGIESRSCKRGRAV